MACTLAHCTQCATVTTCSQCQAPFVVNGSQICGCPATYVEVNSACVCPANFFEFSNVCYNCTVSYCSSCHADNYCFNCLNSFVNVNGSCQCPDASFVIDSSTCVCPALTTLYNAHCFACNITYCLLCQQESQCSNCSAPFVPSADGSQCVCPATFVQSGDSCVCPNGFVLDGSQCVACTLEYCTQCSTVSTCGQCQPPFVVTSGSCECPASYTEHNQSCICPAGTTESNGFCYNCNVQYCTQCTQNDVCGQCMSSFLVNSGSCQCPDASY